MQLLLFNVSNKRGLALLAFLCGQHTTPPLLHHCTITYHAPLPPPGELLSEGTKAKFVAPAQGADVVEREYIVTMLDTTPPARVTRTAKCVVVVKELWSVSGLGPVDTELRCHESDAGRVGRMTRTAAFRRAHHPLTPPPACPGIHDCAPPPPRPAPLQAAAGCGCCAALRWQPGVWLEGHLLQGVSFLVVVVVVC